MVGTYSTVEKRAKRMPDATGETTKIFTQSSIHNATGSVTGCFTYKLYIETSKEHFILVVFVFHKMIVPA